MKFSLIILALTVLVCVSASQHHRSARKGVEGRANHKANRKQYHSGRSIGEPSLKAKIERARKLVKNTKYVAVTTQSSRDDIKGYAFADVQFTADGPTNNSTGIPYFYMAKTDPNYVDILKDDKASILYSQAPDGSCDHLPFKAKDPKCGVLDLTGDFEIITPDASDYEFAWNALVQKFPAVNDLDRNAYDLLKMDIIAVFDIKEDQSAEQLPLKAYLDAKI